MHYATLGASTQLIIKTTLSSELKEALIDLRSYNTTFPEGLYRFTQIVDDANAPAVPVLFTWASRGHLTDYVYDFE